MRGSSPADPTTGDGDPRLRPMESPVRVWIGRLLPWAAFGVALVFAFAQLAKRHAAVAAGAGAAKGAGAVPEGGVSMPVPARAAPELALPPLPDHRAAEHRDALLAVTRARLALATPTRDLVPVVDPAPPSASASPQRDGPPPVDAARIAARLSPLEIRALALRVPMDAALAREAAVLVPWLPPGRERDRLVAALAEAEAGERAER